MENMLHDEYYWEKLKHSSVFNEHDLNGNYQLFDFHRVQEQFD